MSYLHTESCVHCGKPATTWSGHVLRHGKKIIAGWCDKHASCPAGFVGHYRKWMGKYDSEKKQAKP